MKFDCVRGDGFFAQHISAEIDTGIANRHALWPGNQSIDIVFAAQTKRAVSGFAVLAQMIAMLHLSTPRHTVPLLNSTPSAPGYHPGRRRKNYFLPLALTSSCGCN